jgi:hypothetical protein
MLCQTLILPVADGLGSSLLNVFIKSDYLFWLWMGRWLERLAYRNWGQKLIYKERTGHTASKAAGTCRSFFSCRFCIDFETQCSFCESLYLKVLVVVTRYPLIALKRTLIARAFQRAVWPSQSDFNVQKVKSGLLGTFKITFRPERIV